MEGANFILRFEIGIWIRCGGNAKMRCEKHTGVVWMRVEGLRAWPYIETGVDSVKKWEVQKEAQLGTQPRRACIWRCDYWKSQRSHGITYPCFMHLT